MAKIDDSVKRKFQNCDLKGFTDEWEQRKLGDEVRIVMGQSPNSEKIILMILMGAKNAKTYFVLVKQKIQNKWYMIMTMKQSKTKPSDLREAPDDHETLLNTKSPM